MVLARGPIGREQPLPHGTNPAALYASEV